MGRQGTGYKRELPPHIILYISIFEACKGITLWKIYFFKLKVRLSDPKPRVCMFAQSLQSSPCLCDLAHQAPLSMRFSRQEYWSDLPCPAPGDLSDPGIEPTSPTSHALQADSLLLSHQGSPLAFYSLHIHSHLGSLLPASHLPCLQAEPEKGIQMLVMEWRTALWKPVMEEGRHSRVRKEPGKDVVSGKIQRINCITHCPF